MKVKTKVGDKTIYLYSKVYKLEKVKLIRLLKSKNINPKSTHIDFYTYLVENQNLVTFFKSERTVRNLKRDFIKIAILKKSRGVKFLRLIKLKPTDFAKTRQNMSNSNRQKLPILKL